MVDLTQPVESVLEELAFRVNALEVKAFGGEQPKPQAIQPQGRRRGRGRNRQAQPPAATAPEPGKAAQT